MFNLQPFGHLGVGKHSRNLEESSPFPSMLREGWLGHRCQVSRPASWEWAWRLSIDYRRKHVYIDLMETKKKKVMKLISRVTERQLKTISHRLRTCHSVSMATTLTPVLLFVKIKTWHRRTHTLTHTHTEMHTINNEITQKKSNQVEQ